jgi:tyrosine-specific transport protein
VKKPGSVLGGMLLIAGSCIGAGMLALPIMTGLAGFFPSLLSMIAAWAFMTFTGLLLVEMCGWDYGEVHILSLAKESLGEWGRFIGWITYVFLFYSLLVAYVSASGTVFAAILEDVFGLHLLPWVASLIFTLVFGFIVYLGTRPVDLLNRVLMAGLIVGYFGMIGLGIFRVHSKLFLHVDPKFMLISLPVLVISFGFQNMVPSMTAYLRGDLKRVRFTVLGGSVMTLFVYLLWSILVLGTIPIEGISESFRKCQEATVALRQILGNDNILLFANAFAFFAIVTSFLAQAWSLVHFLADGFKRKGDDEAYFHQKNMWWLCLLAIVPPLILALYVPQLFFTALRLGGGIFAMILFGVLPITMIWIGRYKLGKESSYTVKGGKTALVLAAAFTLLVIGQELYHLLTRYGQCS